MNTRSLTAQQRWRPLIQRQRSSGLGVARFCRKHHVPVSSFYAWKRRLAEGRRKIAPTAFVAVHPVAAEEPSRAEAQSAGVELHLSENRRVVLRRGFDEPTLRRLLSVLQPRPLTPEAQP
jgi:transposase-like protein